MEVESPTTTACVPPCAGTFPLSPDGCTVVVFTANNFPSLPKGTRMAHEGILECAIRETREECGLQLNASQLTSGGKAVVEYAQRNAAQPVCAYFFVRLHNKPDVAPQAGDDDIVEARWVPLTELPMLAWRPNRRTVLKQLSLRAALYGGGTREERLSRRETLARLWEVRKAYKTKDINLSL
jgi:8-oxo-dGTP pyrophosphatase MutT (NUDIX family)